MWVGILCMAAFAARAAFCLLFVDLKQDYYWEYGEIGKNLLHGKGYSLWYYTENKWEHLFNRDAQPHPSAYMLPGYVVYLLPFLLIKNVVARNLLLLGSHILLAVVLIPLTYHFTKRYFSARSALWASAFVALLPEFVYATTSYTPTVLYHVAIMLLLLLLYDDQNMQSTKAQIGIALLMLFTIYLRPEFLLFAGIILVCLLKQRNIKGALVIGGMIVLLLLPWQMRNYATFHRFVPLGTSFGLNFYRGHNPDAIASWGMKIPSRQSNNSNTTGSMSSNWTAFTSIMRSRRYANTRTRS